MSLESYYEMKAAERLAYKMGYEAAQSDNADNANTGEGLAMDINYAEVLLALPSIQTIIGTNGLAAFRRILDAANPKIESVGR